MVSGRAWTVAQWMDRIVAHRLVGHLARRLVWRARAKGAESTFCWSVEGDAHDANFEPVDLSGFETVELAHPASLEELGAWTSTFAELEIVQPFDQLARPCVLRPTVEPGARLDGQKLADVAVALGWELTGAQWYRAPLMLLHGADDEAAGIELDYGIEVSGTRRVKPNQRVQMLVRFFGTCGDDEVPTHALNPALRSELLWLLDVARI